MRTVNIHEAKNHLSRLVDQAAKGETFVIAKGGKPLVKVVPIEQTSRRAKFGFLKGRRRSPTISIGWHEKRSRRCSA